MNIFKKAFLFLVFLLTCRYAFSQDIDTLNKITIEDYRAMEPAKQAAVRQNLLAILKADSNFNKYNELERANELAIMQRDKSKALINTKPYPKTEEEWEARYRQEGLTNPTLYYQNQKQSTKELLAVVKKYAIFSKLSYAERAEIIKEATVMPQSYYKELEKAARGQ